MKIIPKLVETKICNNEVHMADEQEQILEKRTELLSNLQQLFAKSDLDFREKRLTLLFALLRWIERDSIGWGCKIPGGNEGLSRPLLFAMGNNTRWNRMCFAIAYIFMWLGFKKQNSGSSPHGNPKPCASVIGL